jgi:hypothetical protein
MNGDSQATSKSGEKRGRLSSNGFENVLETGVLGSGLLPWRLCNQDQDRLVSTPIYLKPVQDQDYGISCSAHIDNFGQDRIRPSIRG